MHIARTHEPRNDHKTLILHIIDLEIPLDYKDELVQYVPIREAGGLSDVIFKESKIWPVKY